MSTKVKGVLSLLFMSLAFYMMLENNYTRALGDYILEFIGLRSWTGYNYHGTHLTIYYFGILFFIGLISVRKYVIDGLNFKKRHIFFIFVALIIMFNSITGITVRNIKKNSDGLLTIGYGHNSNNSLYYKYENSEIIEFRAEFELTNYSNEKKTFYISIKSHSLREQGLDFIDFYTACGERAVFELEGNETRTFLINLDDYETITGLTYAGRGSSSSGVYQIVLTDEKGNKVLLDKNIFFGIELIK